MKIKSIGILCLILFVLVMMLTACSGITELIPAEEHEQLYFYGVTKSGGRYYACILTEYQEDPTEKELFHVPLAEEIVASFQPVGLIGAWNPTEYFSPGELKQAYQSGKIAKGAVIRYGMTDNIMTHLYEENYYKNFDPANGS